MKPGKIFMISLPTVTIDGMVNGIQRIGQVMNCPCNI